MSSNTSREIQRVVAFSKLCEEHQVTPTQVAQSVQFLEKIGCAVSLPVLVAEPEEAEQQAEEEVPVEKISKLSPKRRKSAVSGIKKSWEEARKYADQHGMTVSEARSHLASQKNR